MIEISKAIGEKIKQAREEKNITQKELGSFLGYSPMGISHFEKGIRELKISDLERIAKFFGKDLSYFVSSGQTIFRATNNCVEQNGIQNSIDSFNEYLIKHKKKK